jgi:signal transduction histidine kinase
MGFGVFIHRTDSIYDDSPAEQYQFPSQYLGRVQACVEDWVMAAVIHDLGNLIQVATSAFNILSRSRCISRDKRASQIILSAQASLERAGGLVRQSLRSARGGYTPIDSVCVGTCLFDLKALLEKIWEPEIHFEVQAEPNLPRLACNVIGFQTVLLNLIVNARDAMPDGGTILLAARALVAAGVAGVEIVVADDGLGMTRETLERAFTPLFTTRSSRDGGYGLSAVKTFVQAADGDIQLESEPGVGTRITMTLPAYGIT